MALSQDAKNYGNRPRLRGKHMRSGPLADIIREVASPLQTMEFTVSHVDLTDAGKTEEILLPTMPVGAEVIKVEPPKQGDPMRVWGREKAHGKSLWWPVVARNKKSVTLNLREAEGQAIARDLISKADFLLENFRPGTMERWNLSYEELSKINPGLIMIRVSGYGQTGPYSNRAGFGAVGCRAALRRADFRPLGILQSGGDRRHRVGGLGFGRRDGGGRSW